MRKKGYDVIAKTRPEDNDPLDKVNQNVFIGQRWRLAGSKTSGKVFIEHYMENWGEGAIAEVSVGWRTDDPSDRHVFIAEVINGKIVFSDPQNGSLDASNYFKIAVPGATMFSRVDHLEPSSFVDECCTTRKG